MTRLGGGLDEIWFCMKELSRCCSAFLVFHRNQKRLTSDKDVKYVPFVMVRESP